MPICIKPGQTRRLRLCWTFAAALVLVASSQAVASGAWSGPIHLSPKAYVWSPVGKSQRNGILELPSGGALALLTVDDSTPQGSALVISIGADGKTTSSPLPTPVGATDKRAPTPGLRVTASWTTLVDGRQVAVITHRVAGSFVPPTMIAKPGEDWRLLDGIPTKRTTFVLGAEDQLFTTTLSANGEPGAPVALPDSEGVEQDSVESARTRDGKADGVAHWLQTLAPATTSFADPIPLPSPGGSFRVAGAAIGSDGTAYVAEIAEWGGTGLVVWAQQNGPVSEPRHSLSVSPPLLVRRPWMALAVDPLAIDEPVQLVPAARGGRVLAVWQRGSGDWQNADTTLHSTVMTWSSATPILSYGMNGDALAATAVGQTSKLRLVWGDGHGALREADPSKPGSRVLVRTGIAAAGVNVATNETGAETIAYLQLVGTDTLVIDAVRHA